MIQEANIGVGIAGVEGYQAALAADYAIAQFRFLQKLLLVHGRWSYRRVSLMSLTFFYKNIIWVFVLFWSQFYNAFSAQIVFDYSYIAYYNLFFTVIPNLLMGIFDKDVGPRESLQYPRLYASGLKQEQYNTSRFWMYILDALYQSLVCFFGGYFLYTLGPIDSTGLDTDQTSFGTALAIYTVFTVNVYIAYHIKDWTWIMVVANAVNMVLFPLYVWVYAIYSDSSPILGLDQQLLASPAFWLSTPLVVFVSVAPRLLYEFLRTWLFPSDVDVVREMLYLKRKAARAARRHPTPTPSLSEPTLIVSSPDDSSEIAAMRSSTAPPFSSTGSTGFGSTSPLSGGDLEAATSSSTTGDTTVVVASHRPWIPRVRLRRGSAPTGTPLSSLAPGSPPLPGHPSSVPSLRDEEVEMRPRTASRTYALHHAALDTLLGTWTQAVGTVSSAVETVRGFGKQQRERLRRVTAPLRPSFLLYMGQPDAHRRPQPHTGFAFSADEALPLPAPGSSSPLVAAGAAATGTSGGAGSPTIGSGGGSGGGAGTAGTAGTLSRAAASDVSAASTQAAAILGMTASRRPIRHRHHPSWSHSRSTPRAFPDRDITRPVGRRPPPLEMVPDSMSETNVVMSASATSYLTSPRSRFSPTAVSSAVTGGSAPNPPLTELSPASPSSPGTAAERRGSRRPGVGHSRMFSM